MLPFLPYDVLHVCHTAGHEWDNFYRTQGFTGLDLQGMAGLLWVQHISQPPSFSAHCNLQPLVVQ